MSESAHEEITSMIHSNSIVASYFYNKELLMTQTIKNLLVNNGYKDEHLNEKVHIMMGLIDNLCHEIIYHKHINMDYDIMTNLVIENIKTLFKKDLV